MNREGQERLSLWFGLSYASFLTLPRVLMERMPDEWQEQMAQLLEEYDEAFPNQPNVYPTVVLKDGDTHQFVKMPDWLTNYRHPDWKAIDELRRQP